MSTIPPPCPFDLEVPHPETLANFALLDGSVDAMFSYWRLAVETVQHISKLEHSEGRGLGPRWFEVDGARRAIFCLEKLSELEDRPDLIRRWSQWSGQFETIAKRSPKWRLKDMISDISETHAYLSWPNRWERTIWEWGMASSEPVECPFIDHRRVIDPEFRKRLRETIEEAKGFLYRCEESGQIVFASNEELDRIWWHQDHLAAIDRDKPFGFFHDASLPNFTMRAVTEKEERMFASIARHQRRERGWLRRLLRRYNR